MGLAGSGPAAPGARAETPVGIVEDQRIWDIEQDDGEWDTEKEKKAEKKVGNMEARTKLRDFKYEVDDHEDRAPLIHASVNIAEVDFLEFPHPEPGMGSQ